MAQAATGPEEATSPGRNSPERGERGERVAPVAGLQLGHGMEAPWNLGMARRAGELKKSPLISPRNLRFVQH